MPARKGNTVVLTKKGADQLRRQGNPDARIGMLANVARTFSRWTYRGGLYVQVRSCYLELQKSAMPQPPFGGGGWELEEAYLRVVKKKGRLLKAPDAKAVLRELYHIRDILRFSEPELSYKRKLVAWLHALRLTLNSFTVQEGNAMAQIPLEEKVLINVLGGEHLQKMGIGNAKPNLLGIVKAHLDGNKYELAMLTLLDGKGEPQRVVLPHSYVTHVVMKERLRGQVDDPMLILAEIVFCKEILRFVDNEAYQRRIKRVWKKARSFIARLDRGEIKAAV